MRISDWSQTCALPISPINAHLLHLHAGIDVQAEPGAHLLLTGGEARLIDAVAAELGVEVGGMDTPISIDPESGRPWRERRSEEHTSELQSLMRISYAVFCLKKKKNKHTEYHTNITPSKNTKC